MVNFKINNTIAQLVKQNKLNWNSLLGVPNYKYSINELNTLSQSNINHNILNPTSALIEYVDAFETSTLLISMSGDIKD